ncbi:hypothetical protein HPB49_007088 [Dermacentor silvarum]|uniref:Uncharacterized protein n=1 Tax=Dermacentor silvarum TaxID=543639 RepID=A0ACB8DXN5_DERSI|nr:hypothetical protein HPB49_007088 [Dermacentor silvarum]
MVCYSVVGEASMDINFSGDEVKKFLGSGGSWTADLTHVPHVCERVIEAHFGHNRQPSLPLSDITFRKLVMNKTVRAKAKRKLPPGFQSKEQSVLKNFRERMAQCAPHLLWNRYSASKPAPVQNTSGIADIVDLHSRECWTLFSNYWAQQVPLTAAERTKICIDTVGQNNNPLWKAERTGRLTASNFHRIMRCIKPDGLVRDILYPRQKENLGPSDPRLYGLRNEAVAVEKYIAIMQLYDKDIEVSETGLHVHEAYPFIAASPDRLVRDGTETGLLEAICRDGFRSSGPRSPDGYVTSGSDQHLIATIIGIDDFNKV